MDALAANAPVSRPHLFGLLPEQLAEHLRAAGYAITDGEARRVMARTLAPPGFKKNPRRNPLAKWLLAAVEETFDRAELELVERVEDPADHFVKYLFRSPDGALHEAVRIPLEKPGAFTVCLSSQVGCAMACDFCATGRLGLTRNLAAWEMVAAFMAVRDEAPGRVTGAVFQGQGEPLHNYEQVIQAARVLSDPCGCQVSGPSITISTVGLVPQIRRYTREGHRFRLVISLTSALADKRARLLPVAGRFDLHDLADAIAEYARSAGGRVTVAWVLMQGINDDRAEAEALAGLLRDVPVRISLIDVNDARQDGYRRTTDAERKSFMSHLQLLAAPIVRRYSGGAGRHAACGMLAATRFSPPTQNPS